MLPSLSEELNHRFSGSIIGYKAKTEIRPFKVDRVEEHRGEPAFFGSVGERRKSSWYYSGEPVDLLKVTLETPTTGYINCYKESPLFSVFLERLPSRQYKRGINKESHKLYLIKENLDMMRYTNKLIPAVDTLRPRYLYYVYNRRYIPFIIAIDLIKNGKAYSVALNKRYALYLSYPWDTPTIHCNGRPVGIYLYKDNKFLIINSAKECVEELYELTGQTIEVLP
jgi:hypothetical protein